LPLPGTPALYASIMVGLATIALSTSSVRAEETTDPVVSSVVRSYSMLLWVPLAQVAFKRKFYAYVCLEPTMADDEVGFATILSPRTVASIRGQSNLASKDRDGVDRE
jgi:hypothetical protein